MRKLAGTLGACVALIALGAGCGGGNGGEDDALRKELEAGAAKVTAASSLRSSTLIEVEDGGATKKAICVNLDVDGHRPESFDLSYYDTDCNGGADPGELIVVGRRAWASSGPGGWSEAKIDPKLLHGLDDPQTELQDLFAQAEDIEASREGEGTPYADTSYTFAAPNSAFQSAEGVPDDADVSFGAVIDRHGYLDTVTVHGDSDGTGVTVTDSFEDFGQDLGIEPPDPSEVHGPVTTIRSREDLEALIGGF